LEDGFLKFADLFHTHNLYQFYPLKRVFFHLDRRGFLTPLRRDKNVPPIGFGANLGFFKDLKCCHNFYILSFPFDNDIINSGLFSFDMLVRKREVCPFTFKRTGCHRLGLSIRIFGIFSFFFFLVLILSCEKEREGEFKSKTHSPPMITSANVLPDKPNQESELNLVIRSQDPEGNPVHYRYQWVRNDEEIVGENRSTLKSENFRKGDLIQVKVTPSNGKIDGKAFVSDPIRILNSPPTIEEVGIEPKMVFSRDNLRVYVKSFDRDGDFVYYTYQWEKNGVVLNEERSEILERTQFRKGDSIRVTVTPDDRETPGSPKKSEPVLISNSPPIIISSPPTTTEGTIYLYKVKASEPDNDPIAFNLKSSPKGMEIDKNTGLIRWEIRPEERGSHLIVIEASDNEGAKSVQQYTLTVEFK